MKKHLSKRNEMVNKRLMESWGYGNTKLKEGEEEEAAASAGVDDGDTDAAASADVDSPTAGENQYKQELKVLLKHLTRDKRRSPFMEKGEHRYPDFGKPIRMFKPNHEEIDAFIEKNLYPDPHNTLDSYTGAFQKVLGNALYFYHNPNDVSWSDAPEEEKEWRDGMKVREKRVKDSMRNVILKIILDYQKLFQSKLDHGKLKFADGEWTTSGPAWIKKSLMSYMDNQGVNSIADGRSAVGRPGSLTIFRETERQPGS